MSFDWDDGSVDPADLESLADLAARYQVATNYWDQAGNFHQVRWNTVARVLDSLGASAVDPTAVADSLSQHWREHWQRVLPPVFLHRQSAEGRIWVHVPHGSEVSVTLTTESRQVSTLRQVEDFTEPQLLDGREIGQASFAVSADLEVGYHTVTAVGADGVFERPLIVVPDRLPDPPSGWGVQLQLYAVRSADSWGLGDLADLRTLAQECAREHADFLLINPIHAAEPVPPVEPSPYLPSSRRFVNPIYLRVEEVPEVTEEVLAKQASEIAELRERNHTAELLDRNDVWQLKLTVLAEAFANDMTPTRQESFRDFCSRSGPPLTQYADWSAEQNPEHPADFFMWLQWLTQNQLAAVQHAAVTSGMRYGIVHDLAVGVHGEGADSELLTHVIAEGVSVGAPPDVYNQQGQNWAQPPWNPVALAQAGFQPYIDVIRAVLRDSGGVRIDHIIGLFRQWWIPDHNSADDGTYVAMDHEALIGILVLEASRAGAFVVGEDLGTVEDWIKDSLADRNILGTGVLWFEQSQNGILPPDQWRPDELATVTVHDLPPVEPYLRGDHVFLRFQLGVLTETLGQSLREHAREVASWLSVLGERKLVAAADLDAVVQALVKQTNGEHPWADAQIQGPLRSVAVGLHEVLLQSPAKLRAVSLVDLVEDQHSQNVPGTNREYPNWSVPLTTVDGSAALLTDDLLGSEFAQQILARFR